MIKNVTGISLGPEAIKEFNNLVPTRKQITRAALDYIFNNISNKTYEGPLTKQIVDAIGEKIDEYKRKFLWTAGIGGVISSLGAFALHRLEQVQAGTMTVKQALTTPPRSKSFAVMQGAWQRANAWWTWLTQFIPMTEAKKLGYENKSQLQKAIEYQRLILDEAHSKALTKYKEDSFNRNLPVFSTMAGIIGATAAGTALVKYGYNHYNNNN